MVCEVINLTGSLSPPCEKVNHKKNMLSLFIKYIYLQ